MIIQNPIYVHLSAAKRTGTTRPTSLNQGALFICKLSNEEKGVTKTHRIPEVLLESTATRRDAGLLPENVYRF